MKKKENSVNVCTLTTVDNPFDPYKQFDEWFRYDELKGYNTCSLFARIAKIPDIPSNYEQALANEKAVDSIISLHPTLYKKVIKEVYTVSED